MDNRDAVLISAEELMHSTAQPAILDVRWRLDQPDGRATYLAGHIPGAVYVSLDDELSDHSRQGLGRHPLPSGTALEAAARQWGLRRGGPVVVYDDWNRAGSARAWWVLTAAGLTDVRILDGGLSAWLAAGGELEQGPVTATPGDIAIPYDDLYAGARPVLTADEVAAGTVSTLLDARAPERYRGEVEPMDPVAGHVPGARNLPSMSVLGTDGRFLPGARVEELVDGMAGTSTAVYCGSGVTASVVLAALASVGVDAALFPGSWSQWSAESRPAARG